MKICGACERELPEDSYSQEQGRLRQSIRRCEECVAVGNQLVLMKKSSKRSEDDDCPICNLPLPLVLGHSCLRACCMKTVCNGCLLAAAKRGMNDCPFCRTPIARPAAKKELAMVRKRAKAGDPLAIFHIATKYDVGHGVARDVTRALELYERAAVLGANEAHFNLGITYYFGTDVKKDIAKAIQHFEAAAMRGHVMSRYNIGCAEENARNYDLALQHWMIAAMMGYQDALNKVKEMFMKGFATKADYAEALRGYQSAVEEMRSPDRVEALALGSDNILSMIRGD